MKCSICKDCNKEGICNLSVKYNEQSTECLSIGHFEWKKELEPEVLRVDTDGSKIYK
jgi:hypothetical protein